MGKVLTYHRFLIESEKTEPDWHGLETWCASQVLPDCVPKDVRAWSKFRREFESGRIGDYKHSPRECLIDLDNVKILKFRKYGVDLLDFMRRDIHNTIQDNMPPPGRINSTEYTNVRSLIDRYYDNVDRGSNPEALALYFVLKAGRIGMAEHHISPLSFNLAQYNKFLAFIGVSDRVDIKKCSIYNDIAEHWLAHVMGFITKSGKTAEELATWVANNLLELDPLSTRGWMNQNSPF